MGVQAGVLGSRRLALGSSGMQAGGGCVALRASATLREGLATAAPWLESRRNWLSTGKHCQ